MEINKLIKMNNQLQINKKLNIAHKSGWWRKNKLSLKHISILIY